MRWAWKCDLSYVSNCFNVLAVIADFAVPGRLDGITFLATCNLACTAFEIGAGFLGNVGFVAIRAASNGILDMSAAPAIGIDAVATASYSATGLSIVSSDDVIGRDCFRCARLVGFFAFITAAATPATTTAAIIPAAAIPP